MKKATEYLAEANAAAPRISSSEAIETHREGDAIFIDERDSKMLTQNWTIAGAQHVPRGMIELSAYPSPPITSPPFKRKPTSASCAAAVSWPLWPDKPLLKWITQK